MIKHREKEIPKEKLDAVKSIEELIKNSNTVMICSVKNLPGKQYQEIKKKLRGEAKVKVVKKNVIFRAIDNSGIEIKKMKEYVKEDVALLFSELDIFKNKTTSYIECYL